MFISPDICSLICDALQEEEHQATLAALCLCNKQWNQVATPLLYKAVWFDTYPYVDPEDWEEGQARVCALLRTLSAENGPGQTLCDLVRKFSWTTLVRVAIMRDSFSNDVPWKMSSEAEFSLAFDSDPWIARGTTSEDEAHFFSQQMAIFAVLRRCRNMQSLALRATILDNTSCGELIRSALDWIPVSNLQALRLGPGPYGLPDVTPLLFAPFLRRCLGTIEHLTLGAPLGSAIVNGLIASPARLTHLVLGSIYDPEYELEETGMMEYFTPCMMEYFAPTLTSLSIDLECIRPVTALQPLKALTELSVTITLPLPAQLPDLSGLVGLNMLTLTHTRYNNPDWHPALLSLGGSLATRALKLPDFTVLQLRVDSTMQTVTQSDFPSALLSALLSALSCGAFPSLPILRIDLSGFFDIKRWSQTSSDSQKLRGLARVAAFISTWAEVERQARKRGIRVEPVWEGTTSYLLAKQALSGAQLSLFAHWFTAHTVAQSVPRSQKSCWLQQ